MSTATEHANNDFGLSFIDMFAYNQFGDGALEALVREPIRRLWK